MKVVVIGGGISGQLVQHVIPDAEVYEGGAKPERKLTREWGANYLWEPIPGLECRQFQVVTHIDGKMATPDSVRAYKARIGKSYETVSNEAVRILLSTQFRPQMLGYEMVNGVPATVTYDHRAVAINLHDKIVYWSNGRCTKFDWLVNTIPLFMFLELIEDAAWRVVRVETKFASEPIYVRVMPKPPDAPYPDDHMYVNYLTTPEHGPYRYCDRGKERHYEAITNMGHIPNKKLIPGKIHNLPAGWHRRIMDGLLEHQTVCFGRYGAWHSDELVHDTYRDIRRFRNEVMR